MTGLCHGGPWSGQSRTFLHNRIQVANGGRSWAGGGIIAGADGEYWWNRGGWQWIEFTAH